MNMFNSYLQLPEGKTGSFIYGNNNGNNGKLFVLFCRSYIPDANHGAGIFIYKTGPRTTLWVNIGKYSSTMEHLGLVLLFLKDLKHTNGHFRNLNWRYLPYIRPI